MERVLKEELGLPDLTLLRKSKGGMINEGHTYQAGDGRKVFVKINKKSEARQMFDGELVSLQHLTTTETVRVPQPIKVIDILGGGAMLAMEYLFFGNLSDRFASQLGEQMARLHSHNSDVKSRATKADGIVGQSDKYHYVDKFGFDITTCCGYTYIAQDNSWQSDWVSHFGRKLEIQMNLIEREDRKETIQPRIIKVFRNIGHGERTSPAYSKVTAREARELWSKLQLILPTFFEGIEISPALLHGDLWEGNVGENDEGPVIFDPACFYGHSEFELAISRMFGGFDQSFFDTYYKILPPVKGFRKRMDLYKLFNFLNHWNHFGTSYRDSSISTFRKILK